MNDDKCTTCEKMKLRRTFIAGYLHGRSSLGNSEAAGREANEAFERWYEEMHANKRGIFEEG